MLNKSSAYNLQNRRQTISINKEYSCFNSVIQSLRAAKNKQLLLLEVRERQRF